jgi:serine/threonine-protein kinase
MHFCPVTGRPFGNVAERMIGRTLGGKYRLERAIGQGGMGTIFEATHTGIGSKVAVKLLHEAFAEKREPVQRLYREARATGAVGHPGIIRVFDVGETADGIPFLVMELLAGESLGEHIERLGPRPLGFVLDVGAQMLSAMHAAHEAGIVHRDLKSDNVFLLAGEGDGVRVKILDFGISKITTPEGESLRLTQTGSVLGTPYYMAPEQARGFKDLDRRVDIYAAGVILYELLLGTIPHRASNYNALLIEILTQDVGPFGHLRPDVPERLEAAVLRALCRSREARWPDAASLKAELDAIRAALPAAALRGEAPAVTAPPSLRSTHDSETVDFDSLPFEPPAGEAGPAFERGALPAGPGRRRRALLLGAGGALVLAGGLLAGLLTLGGEADEPPPVESAPLIREPPPVAAPVATAEPPPARMEDAGPVPLAAGAEALPEKPPARPKPPAGTRPGKAGKSVVEKDDVAPASTKEPRPLPKGEGKDKPALDRPMDNPF